MKTKEIDTKMYLIYWCSRFSSESEDICICRTEEDAIQKCKELGIDYFYKELAVIERKKFKMKNEEEEMTCYNCNFWAKGMDDGTCIHYINKHCPYGFSAETEYKKT